MSSSDCIISEFDRGVLRITLDRPKANAFNEEMVIALQTVMKRAGRDDEIRAILLTGSGTVFSAGQDVKDFQAAAGEISFRRHLQRTYNPLVVQIRQIEKPVLAAINGPVAGAALGLVLACDLRIAADTARFVVGFLGIGLAPDSAVSLFLPALIGLGRAAQLAFSNEALDAQTAYEWGLVNQVVPSGELPERAFEWALRLAQGPVRAMGLAKRDFNRAILPNLEQVLDYEAYNQDIAGRGAEHKEGVSAFLEKRAARFV